MSNSDALWLAWSTRFDYWRAFSVNAHGCVLADRDWWLSRFDDDHKDTPDRYTWDPDTIWVRYIAPELGAVTKPLQMRLLR